MMVAKTNFVPLLLALLCFSLVFIALAQDQKQTLNTAGTRPLISGQSQQGEAQQEQPQGGGVQQGQPQEQSDQIETGEGEGEDVPAGGQSTKLSSDPLADSKRFFFMADKVQIDVMNGLPPSSDPLIVHCKSKNDDFGNHTLWRWGYFYWRFRPAFWANTLYWCNWYWGKNHASFDVYNDDGGKNTGECELGRDYEHVPDLKNITNVCHWQARFDGFYWTKYLGIAQKLTDPRWEKRYEWNKEYRS